MTFFVWFFVQVALTMGAVIAGIGFVVLLMLAAVWLVTAVSQRGHG